MAIVHCFRGRPVRSYHYIVNAVNHDYCIITVQLLRALYMTVQSQCTASGVLSNVSSFTISHICTV